jgi:hypothetical protein
VGVQCWLEDSEGLRIPVKAGGVLIGRNPDCDLVLEHPQVSRYHAVIRSTLAGIELLLLGRNPAEVNGTLVGATHALKVDDAITFAGAELVIKAASTKPRAAPPRWAVRIEGGKTVTIQKLPYTILGTIGGDLTIPGLGDRVLTLEGSGRQHLQLLGFGDVHINNTPLDGGEGILKSSDEVRAGDVAFSVILLEDPVQETTITDPRNSAPTSVRLQFLPTGGRLVVTMATHQVSAYLAERRCALVAVLLQPPSDFAPGDFIPDDVVCPRVWGRGEGDRNHLNVLISRVRRDLDVAGLDGYSLLRRAQGGGATCFQVEEGTSVEVS